MIDVVNREIVKYLDRVDLQQLIQSHTEGKEPLCDPVYSNEKIYANELRLRENYSSDFIRLGLNVGESNIGKVCKLRGIKMSALVRLIIVRYVDEYQALSFYQLLSLTNIEKDDLVSFNIGVDMYNRFTEICKQKDITKSYFLKIMTIRYLKRIEYNNDGCIVNSDSEFPENEVKKEELRGESKCVKLVLGTSEKNGLKSACQSRGIYPSYLFRLMIRRFTENPSRYEFVELGS